MLNVLGISKPGLMSLMVTIGRYLQEYQPPPRLVSLLLSLLWGLQWLETVSARINPKWYTGDPSAH